MLGLKFACCYCYEDQSPEHKEFVSQLFPSEISSEEEPSATTESSAGNREAGVNYWCFDDEDDESDHPESMVKGYEEVAARLVCQEDGDLLDVCVLKTTSKSEDWDNKSNFIGVKLACCHCGEFQSVILIQCNHVSSANCEYYCNVDLYQKLLTGRIMFRTLSPTSLLLVTCTICR